jgi:hypothetical protein
MEDNLEAEYQATQQQQKGKKLRKPIVHKTNVSVEVAAVIWISLPNLTLTAQPPMSTTAVTITMMTMSILHQIFNWKNNQTNSTIH